MSFNIAQDPVGLTSFSLFARRHDRLLKPTIREQAEVIDVCLGSEMIQAQLSPPNASSVLHSVEFKTI